jgi:hypothetical protein
MNELIALYGTKADRRCESRSVACTWAALARVQAHVVHRTTNRLRLKIPGHKQDAAFFAGLRQELLAQRGIVSVDVNPLTASVLIVHDGSLDLQPEDRRAKHGASQVGVTTGKGMGQPSSRDAALAALAIKLVLVAATQQPSSPIVELCADALAQMVGHALLQRLALAATRPLSTLTSQSRQRTMEAGEVAHES